MGLDYGIISYYIEDLQDVTFSRGYFNGLHVSISEDSKLFAVNYGLLNYTELWDPYNVRPIRKLELKGITAQGKPRFSPNGSSLYVTGQGTWENHEASFIQEWEYTTGKPLDVRLLPEVVDIGRTMDISPSSAVIIFGGVNGGIYITKPRDCHAIKIGQSSSSLRIWQVSFRPDGKLFATIENQNRGVIDLWGIPATGGKNNEVTPMATGPQSPCPKIPMEPEDTTPDEGWSAV
jgi:hypothetical protein